MDFGIARLDTGSVTDTGHFFGSPSYMAPEQVLSGEASARSDLYSFGVVAYEALAGQRPFHADSVATVIYRVVNDPPPAPSTLNASLSSSDDEAFARALAKQPAQRFPTAREFARALVSDASIPADISFEPLLEALLSMPPTVVSDAPPLAAEPAARTPVTASRPPASPDAQATIGLEQGVPRPGRGARGAWLAAGALVLALAGASLVRDGSDAPPPAASGNRALPALRVETDPADALVSVDGAERGRSPLMLSGLSPGRHEVRVAAAGFAPAAVAVEVRPGVPAPPLRFILSPLGGFLSVRSEPAGATVRVDGAVVGSTPLSSVLVEPGRREILLEHAGYLAQMEVVEAQAGRAHEVSARMVASAPRAARVQPPAPVRPREPLPVPAATAPALFTGALVPLDESVVAPRRTFGEPAGYPEAARRLRLAGSVKVEITVGSDGTAEDVRVLESAGAILDDAVVEAVRGWRFEPATKQGVRVRVRWPYRQTFKPS
jgi:TonB family protein